MKILAGTFYRRRQKAKGKRQRAKVCRLFFHLRLLPFAFCLLIFNFSACGKIGDPLPPVPRAPLIIDELSVSQQGTQLMLSFPIVLTQRSPKLQRIDVYRLIESTDDPLGLPEETFSTRATIIYSLPGDQIPLNRSTITYPDPLNLKNGSRNSRYRYAVQLVTSNGAMADFSNYALITPLFDLALPPLGLQATQRETETEITWSAPTANENGTSPANVTAYNIYRRVDGSSETLTKLNTEPLLETRFVDRNFQFGAKYEYVVRALSLLPGDPSLSNAIESDQSVMVYTPKDTFPPAEPTPVTIASIAGIVSLYWPLNSEPDVVGYNIYRAEDEKAPFEKWIKLNPQLHKTASFRDDKVQVGKQYFYQVSAVDTSNNESSRSAIVSELVAP
jgi:hypothetical protein